MNFGEALEALKDGKRVARSGWNGRGMGMWLRFVGAADNRHELLPTGVGDTCVEMTLDPFIQMKTVQNTLVPWLASQTDLLAGDWEIVT